MVKAIARYITLSDHPGRIAGGDIYLLSEGCERLFLKWDFSLSRQRGRLLHENGNSVPRWYLRVERGRSPARPPRTRTAHASPALERWGYRAIIKLFYLQNVHARHNTGLSAGQGQLKGRRAAVRHIHVRQRAGRAIGCTAGAYALAASSPKLERDGRTTATAHKTRDAVLEK